MQLEDHLNDNPSVPCNEDSKKKERHIVSWSQEEDDILREQISIHGTENWAIIASKFKDKTTRQCRRRWYTYLNSDFKKGGWSPEEDMLLCEAQKIFGNRWTEIAKVVSGRTDNAVKNRFSTLCKKRAKYEALAKENATSYINQNNKRCISQVATPIKKIRRSHLPASTKIYNYGDRLHKPNTTPPTNQQPRPPFAVLVQSSCNVKNLPVQHHVRDAKDIIHDAQSKIRGTFLKKDDPKVTSLVQQAELLSSLAERVNTENTDQSFENAWKVLQEFLDKSKEGDVFRYKISDTESIDLQLEDLKDLLEDLRSSNEGSEESWRQPGLSEESPCSSEYSTGSSLLQHKTGDNTEPTLAEISAQEQEDLVILSEKTSVGECENGVLSGETIDEADTFLLCEEQISNDGVTSALSRNEFGSPLQVTPIFRSLAAGIPSPKFSESERNFLLKTLGVDSPSSNANINASQPPPCKRALLKSL